MIYLDQITKSYQNQTVLHSVSLHLEDHATYCLMGSSGSGKTTLLRILLGLETPDSGVIVFSNPTRFAAVFQEDRLCETFSPIENISMVCDKRSTKRSHIEKQLCRILPEESISRPVYTLSGGMKRRVAIVRALMAASNAVLMDEPFTGLDDQTRRQVISYVREMCQGKLLVIATHQIEDVKLLNGKKILLPTLDSDKA